MYIIYCTGVCLYCRDKALIVTLEGHIIHHFKNNEFFCNIITYNL